MKITARKLGLTCLLPALLTAGCSRRDEATVGTPANPLVIVLSPAHLPSEAGALEAMRKRLSEVSGLAIELKAEATPAEAISAFDSGKADAGLLTLEEYLVAREEYGVRPALQALRGKDLSEYEGVLLTRAKDGASSVPALAGRKVAFVGPYSVSGFTLPTLFLEKAGVKVEPDFAAGHDEALKKLLGGEALAAATYARQAQKAPGLKVLAVTGTVPNEPLVFRRGLRGEKLEAVKAAFLSLASTPEGRKALGSVADITGFRPVDSKVYKPLHDLLLANGRAVYDLVPQGWDIYRLNQPYMPDR